MQQPHVAYLCPYCRERNLEAVATLPYVRGFLLAYVHGHKKLIGCRNCVRTQLLKETGVSCLVGWFSPTALIANPFLIVYGLLRSAFVSTNIDAVRKALKEAGIPEPQQQVDLVRVGYGLAAP